MDEQTTKADAKNNKATAAKAAKVTEASAKSHEVEGDELLAGVETVFEDEDRFQSINTSTEFFYKPELEKDGGQTIVLRGIPMARKQRKPEDGKPVQHYLIVKLTAPMVAFDSEGEQVVAQVGELVWADERAQTKLASACLPKIDERGRVSAFEVIMRPKQKKGIGKGRTMWLYDLKSRMLDRNEVDKYGIQAIAQLFNRQHDLDAPALPAASDDDN
jgi:hypothetical protein